MLDRHRLEARELIGLCRQRLQCRRVQLLECAGATSRQLLERPLIQVLEQRADRLIDRVDRLKPVMTQARHDPAFDDLNNENGQRELRAGISEHMAAVFRMATE